MKKLLFFLLAIIFAIQGYSQTVQTSFGTVTQSKIPISAYYGYTYSQQIVTNAELVTGGLGTTFGQITKIRWHWNGLGTFVNNNAWKIYLGHTTQTTFSSTTNWVPLTALTLVYDSVLTIPTAAGWFEFTLQTPFTYNGTDNLVIAVDENTPSYGGFPEAAYFSQTASSNRGIYFFNDITNPDPATPPTASSITTLVPNVQLYFLETCPGPGNLATTSVTDNSATVTWTPNGPATLFNLQYKALADATWTTVSGITTNSYTIPTLNPNTTYQFKVQADCVGDVSAYTFASNFTTSLIPVTLPYFNDFENPATYSDLSLINGTQINKWVISNAAGVNATPNGAYALHITNNDTTNAWAYTPGSSANSSRVYAMMDVVVPAGVTELKLDFDWIANGLSNVNEFLRVYWLPTNIPITAGAIPPTVASVNYDLTAMIGNYTGGYGSHWLSRQTTWQHSQFSINTTQFPTLAGNTWRLLIHWRNDNFSGEQPPATFDNLSIVVSNCPTPTIPIVSNITATSVDLAWTENGTAASWNVSYKPVAATTWTTVQASTNPYTLTNLNGSTAYQIRVNADCGTEESSWSPIATTATLCGPITQFPWAEGFDHPNAAWPAAVAPSNAVVPACWLNFNVGVAAGLWRRTTSTTWFRSGIAGAQFWTGGATSANNDYLITPPISLTGAQRLLFWAKGDGTSVNRVKVRIYDITTVGQDITAMADTSLFVTIMPNTILNNTTWNQYEVFLNQFVGDYRIAFVVDTVGGTYINIDDIVINAMPSCLRPTAIAVSNINSYDATVSWIATDPSQSSWYLYYKPSTATVWDSVQVYGTTHTLLNLTDNTLYQYYLKTDCGTELSEATNLSTFRTACAPFTTLPYVENFDTYGTGSGIFPSCWNYLTTATSIPYIISGTNFSPPGSIYAYLGSGQHTILIAPIPDATINVSDLQVKFYVRGAAGQNIQVGVIEDINNALTFVPVQTIPITATFAQYTAFLSNYTGTGNRIAFRFAPTAWVTHYFDNVEIDLAPTCLPVNNLTVSGVAGSSAYVTWSPNGTPDNFTVAVSELGLETWTNYTTTNSNYVLTGLNQQTAYTVKVYPTCQGFDGPADTMNFVTTCAVGGDIVIGTPSATTSTNGNWFPSQTWYNYSYTQQIYDAADLTVADSIYGIAFQYFHAFNDTRNATVYIGHTSQSSFTAASNYIPLDSMTIVHQGNVAFTNAGEGNWVNINFSTPFEYDGYSNIVVAFADNTGSYQAPSDAKFRTHSVTGNKAIYFYQDSPGAISPANPTAMASGVSTFRNNIKFILPCLPATCIQPNVILTNVTSNNADMIIVPGATETSWEAEFKTAAATTWTSLGTVSTTTYSLPALFSNTTYQVRFRTVCSATENSLWKTVTFTTLCGFIETLPFVDNFDTYASNSIPTCWVRNTTNAGNPYIMATTTSVTSPNALYFYTSSTTYSMVVLPPLDQTIDVNTLQLSIRGRIFTVGNNIKVGVMTNPNDASTFTLVATVGPNQITAYEELFVSFANYTGTGTYIALRSDNMAQGIANTIYIDNLVLDLLPNCVKPTTITYSMVTTNSATASWVPSPSALSYEVVYGLPGLDPLTATPIPVTDTFYEMTPLTATTLYHFYVRSVCANGEFSEWTNLSTFSTVALAGVPYSEPFTSTTIPTGYNLTSFYVGAPAGIPGNPANNIYVNLYSGIPTANFSTINIGPIGANYSLSLDYCFALWSAGGLVPAGSGNFIIAISTDWGTTYTNVATVTNGGVLGYIPYTLSLAAYENQIIKIKITGNWISSDFYLGIDNIYVGSAITCPAPSSLTASNPTTTSIDLAWTENGTATSWEVQYGAPGFTLGTGTSLIANANNPFTVSSLTPSTSYDFYVRSICGIGDTSMWTQKVVGVTACVPITTLPWSEGFETITAAGQLPPCWSATGLGSLTNTQITNFGSYNRNARTGTGAAYFRYGANDRFFTPGFQLTAGVTYDFSYWYVTDGLAGWTSLELGAYSGQTAGTLVQTINTVAAPTNTTYAQVNATFTPTTSGVFYFGIYLNSTFSPWYLTFDDLSLTAQVVTCALPTNLAVSSINTTNATATWTAGGTETQWEVAYKATAASTWITAIVNTTPTYLIPSLTAGTAYDVKVRAICGAADTSAYTAIVNFTTSTVSCNAPTNLAAGTITNTGATITWTAGGTETAWEVDYKLASATTWTTLPATTANLALNGLATCSDYNVRVRAVCGVGIFSSYTAVVNFSTLSPVPTNLQVTNITDQSALATWTANGPATSWQVEYKLVSSANWTTATANATQHPLTGLQSNSLYEVRVKSLCSPNESVFTTPVQFTTLGMTFTITATAGPNGTITPSGVITLNAGANQTFTFDPHNTYHIDVITIDGIPHTSTPTSYTFTNVMGNHTIHVDFAQGIDDNELAQLVELFPNPTSSIIELRLKADNLQVKECKVFDMYGKLMKVIPIHAETTSIDVTDFAAGVYFVRMESERGTISKKFVKK